METVSIRNLRGESLRENALKGKPVAITNRGALIGVIVSVASAWVEHLIDYNWSHVRQSVVEGEQAIAAAVPMITIQDVVPDEKDTGDKEGQSRRTPDRLALTLAAAMVGGSVAQTADTKEILERLRAALNPSASTAGPEDSPAGSSVITVRIGDLTAGLIEKAGGAGQTLAITHERELIGIVIPVTPGLVEFLIEQNMSRVLYNIALSEKQIRSPDKMTTLDEALNLPTPPAAAPRQPALQLVGPEPCSSRSFLSMSLRLSS